MNNRPEEIFYATQTKGGGGGTDNQKFRPSGQYKLTMSLIITLVSSLLAAFMVWISITYYDYNKQVKITRHDDPERPETDNLRIINTSLLAWGLLAYALTMVFFIFLIL